MLRRDPHKSNKDIEQDKLRAKKENDNKILAEKEKAIKNLLDSDNVVPPGTEGEAIQNIVKNLEQQDLRRELNRKRSKDRPRSPIRRRSPYKRYSPRRSPEKRKRRKSGSISPDRRKGPSLDGKSSSAERREISRQRLIERER